MKKEIQKLLKSNYEFDIVNDENFKRFVNILNDFVDWAEKKGIGFSHFISIGNKAVLGEDKLLDALKNDKKPS